MRIIIAGSRTFSDYKLLETECMKRIPDFDKIQSKNSVESNVTIISGHAKGADALGEKFALSHRLGLSLFRADWNKDKRGAGYKRNERMAKYAKDSENGSMLIAFWDGKSKGTKHIIDIAKRIGIQKIEIIEYNEEVKETKENGN
jgi:hypothetical protein